VSPPAGPGQSPGGDRGEAPEKFFDLLPYVLVTKRT